VSTRSSEAARPGDTAKRRSDLRIGEGVVETAFGVIQLSGCAYTTSLGGGMDNYGRQLRHSTKGANFRTHRGASMGRGILLWLL